MLSSILLAAALTMTPGQGEKTLNITNVRSTYGELGGPRPMAPLVPGDYLFLSFDIEGISIDDQGRVQYSMGMEILDSTGATKLKPEPSRKVDFVPLGGSKIPGRAFTSIGLEQAPGEYTLKVIVTDLITKATKTMEQKFKVLPKEFAIIAVYTSIDERGQIPMPTTGFVGQALFVQMGIVGFGRGNDPKKSPNLEIEMLPLDEKGNPTLGKPSLLTVNSGVDEKEAGITIRYLLPLTRTGKYDVRLKATDKVTGKTSMFVLPVNVLPNN
ncbi:MAG: hypothetical protein ACRC8S_18130 [Fimbriiglobus sp.]